jgi:hypothetical protein
MAVSLDRTKQGRQAPLGGGIIGLGNDIGASPFGANELVVERVEVDLLFALASSSIFGYPRADLVLDDHHQPPAVTGVGRQDFQGRDSSDLAQLLAFLVAEAELASRRQVA